MGGVGATLRAVLVTPLVLVVVLMHGISSLLYTVVEIAMSKKYRVHKKGAIVISGGSSGVGRVTALALAKKVVRPQRLNASSRPSINLLCCPFCTSDMQGYTVFAGCRTESAVESMRAEGAQY